MRAVRLIKRVEEAGRLRLENLPLAPGQAVEVIVLPVDEEAGELARLADSGLTFWDNEIDDEVWNSALPPA